MSRILVVLCSALALLQAQDRRITPVDGGRRLALVMGNRAYVRNPLTNPLNDAQDMQRALAADGFQVTVATDTTLKSMQKSIREFGASIRAGDTALFYYSGHGLQVRGVNYLLPVDFQAQSDDAVPDEAYPAQRVQELLEQAGARFRIVILDACRDNPLPSSKSLGRGLAPMNGGEGTYIVFATAENTVASDNPGQRNGLFTKHLLSVMDQPGLTLDQVLKETKRRVAQESRNLQRPWIYSDSTDDFYFRPAASTPVAPAIVPSTRKVDTAALFARGEERFNAGDVADALPFYRQAADAGDKNAMFRIGLIYENGNGVNEDKAEAMRWYRKAADAGDKSSMFRIGLMYGNGWGVKRNYDEAVRWYRKAADAGDARAMFQVGQSYEKGMGVAKNKAEAIAWYERCAAAGDVIGKEALRRLSVEQRVNQN
jgi:uncharacterized caspase-like protein